MNILVATNLYPPHYIGGYELRCADIVEGLRTRGHKVIVLTSTHGVDRPTIDRGVYRILPVFIYGYTKIPGDGVPTQFVKAWSAIRKIRSIVRKHRIDLIYISKVQGFQEPVIAALTQLGVPTVWDISDTWLKTYGDGPWFSYWRKRPDHGWMGLTKRIVRGIVSNLVPVRPSEFGRHSVFYTSDFLRNLYSDHPLLGTMSRVIHCGCPEQFLADKPREFPSRRFRFIYSGQLIEHKGPHTLIEAVGLLKAETREDFEVLIVGRRDSEYVDRLCARADELAISDCITFVGKRRREDMPRVYRQADALVFPSEWDEPFALTILEAMASGLPVISTTTGGSPEIVREGETGLAYNAGNARELAAQMKRLMNDEGLYARLSANGREAVSRGFMTSHMMESIQELLEEALHESRATDDCRCSDEKTLRAGEHPNGEATLPDCAVS